MAALEEDPFQQYDLDDAIGFSLDWHPTRRLSPWRLPPASSSSSTATARSRRKRREQAARGRVPNVRFAPDGESVLSVGSDGSLQRRDVATNKRVWKHAQAHGAAANASRARARRRRDGRRRRRGEAVGPAAADGGAQLHREPDLAADLAFVDGKAPTLVASLADGCLCTFDLRRGALGAMSDNQEDELLSLAPMKNGTKLVVGTESGVLGILSWGDWGDVSDRLRPPAVRRRRRPDQRRRAALGVERRHPPRRRRPPEPRARRRRRAPRPPGRGDRAHADGERLASWRTTRRYGCGTWLPRELKHTARGFKRRQEEAGSSGAQADADGGP